LKPRANITRELIVPNSTEIVRATKVSTFAVRIIHEVTQNVAHNIVPITAKGVHADDDGATMTAVEKAGKRARKGHATAQRIVNWANERAVALEWVTHFVFASTAENNT
jgi:hypothetical protein